ncbi:hypothetical protein ACO0QE_001627 [Hanseniaspora vineae]
MKKEVRDFKKQEFKDILEHLDGLEKKVEALLDVYVNSPINSFNSVDEGFGRTEDSTHTAGQCGEDGLAPGSTIHLEATTAKSKSPSFANSNTEDTSASDANLEDTAVGGVCATSANGTTSVSDASTSPLFLLANAVTSSATAASNSSPQSSTTSGTGNGFANGTGNLNRSSSASSKRGLQELEQNGSTGVNKESDAKKQQLGQNSSLDDANRIGSTVLADANSDSNKANFTKRSSNVSDSTTTEHEPHYFNINTDGSTATVGSVNSFASSSSANLSTTFFKPLTANESYVWSQIRRGIPEIFHQEFDTLDLKIIENNKAKQEIVNKMIENPKIEEIPDIKIIKELLSIIINKLKLHVVIPVEDYDIIGILQKWKTEGYNSLNNSYLLILNVLSLMSCKILLNFLQSGDDVAKNGTCGKDSKCITSGIMNQELLDTEWLARHEEIFLGNSLLYCQSISLFPDGLASVQGILTLLIYLPVVGVNLGNALLLSTAVRIAQDLGLHSELFSEAIQNNKRLRTKKIRVWWFCCFIDEMISTSLMKPHLILKYNTTVTFKARGNGALLDIADEHCRRIKKNCGGFSMNGVDIDDAGNAGNKSNKTSINQEYLDACEVRENLIRYVYSTDGIIPILRHYAFKFSQVFFQNSGRFQTSTPADIYKDVILQISECFEDLPNLIKNHDAIDNNFPQEESFFIYILNLYFIEAQNTCSQGLYDLNNEKYVEFLKGLLKLILKLSKFQTFYLFQEMDCMYFINFLKVIEYNINFEKNVQTFMENYRFLRDFLSSIFNVPLASDGSLGESGCIKNDWRRGKYELMQKTLNIMKELGDMREASAASEASTASAAS